MSERIFIEHLHNLRRGIDLYPRDLPKQTTYLAPDAPISGRFIPALAGGSRIAGRG